MDQLTTELADIERASTRGYFTPDEDERVRARFAQYLTARAGLLQTVNDLRPLIKNEDARIDEHVRLRAFVIAFTAVALLVRAGRFIVEQYAPNKVIQRKLNEAEPRFGIPRKQFTMIYKSLTSPLNAWEIFDAVRFADDHRAEIERLANDETMAPAIAHLLDAEESLRVTKRYYLRGRLRYHWHSWRRRRATAFGQVMFSIFEMSGRAIAEIRNPWHAKRVTPEIQQQLADILQPGDVLISRHDDAASNLFLPGYWIHASLHIGSETAKRELGVILPQDKDARWVDPIRVLEARKDGVLFRPLHDTLSVDAVAVIRPRLAREHLGKALTQAVAHEGKLYDFEFDFFRSDRLVCTEVAYRAFHGVGGMEFHLRHRAGRPTLAAEDLLDMALEGRGFSPVAVFGAPGCDAHLVTGPEVGRILLNSYRR